MLSNKNQKYIFERLLKGYAVSYQPLDEDRFVFTDGVRLFIFSKEQIKFDISKCALGDRLKEFLDGAASGRMYTPSEEIRVNDNKGKTYNNAVSGDTAVTITTATGQGAQNSDPSVACIYSAGFNGQNSVTAAGVDYMEEKTPPIIKNKQTDVFCLQGSMIQSADTRT